MVRSRIRLEDMKLLRVVANVFAENCYVLISDGRGLVIDPGAGTAATVRRLLAAAEAQLAGVVLTHGHPDHGWDAATLAGGAPVYVPSPDLYRMEDPLGQKDPALRSVLTDQLVLLFAEPWTRPTNLHEVPADLFTGDGAEIEGFRLRAIPAPGHTEGSTIYVTYDQWDLEVASWVGRSPGTGLLAFCGDVIFKQGVGRTDLPGGDPDVMAWTLRTLRSVIDPDTWMLPGHGPGTTMADELASNPFLRQ